MAVADKVTNSKVYKSVEKGLVVGSATLMTAGATILSSYAAEIDNTLQNSLAVDESAVPNRFYINTFAFVSQLSKSVLFCLLVFSLQYYYITW